MNPLFDARTERNLGSCYVRLFKKFLLNEINKIQDINETIMNRGSQMDQQNIFQIKNSSSNNNGIINNLFNNDEGKISLNKHEDEINSIFSNEEDLNFLCPFWDISKFSLNNNSINNNSHTTNYSLSYSGLNYNLNSGFNNNQINNPFISNQKNYWHEDVYSFDFQARYFIERYLN